MLALGSMLYITEYRMRVFRIYSNSSLGDNFLNTNLGQDY